MQVSIRRVWLFGVSLIVAVAAVATFVLTAPVSARNNGRTYIVTTVKTRGSTWVAAGRTRMTVGHLSPGDRLVETNEILRDGGVKGLFVATAVIASPRTVAANQAIAFVHAVYRFADGDLYVDGLTSFGTQTGAGVIVGGTGAYAGAQGTLKASEAKDVLHLLP